MSPGSGCGLLAGWLAVVLLAQTGPGMAAEPPGRLDRYGDPLPPGAVARCGALLSLWEATVGKRLPAQSGHRAAVRKLAWAPGGRLLASCDDAGDFRLWEAATGRQVLPVAGHLLRVHDFAFSEDGKTLAAVDGGAVARVWQLPSGKQVRAFRVGEAATLRHWLGKACSAAAHWSCYRRPSFLAFGSGGRILAVAREEGCVDLWDTASGKRLCRLPRCEGTELPIAFSPNRRFLVTGVHGVVLRLWELPAGKLLHDLPRGNGDQEFCAFSPDGRVLAWGWDQTVHLWNLTRSKAMRPLKTPFSPIWAIAFDGSGAALVTLDAFQTVTLWDTATGRRRRRMTSDGAPPPSLEGGAITWETCLLPRGDRTLTLMHLDPETERFTLREVRTGRDLAVFAPEEWLADSNDGRIIAIGRSTVQLLEAATGTEITRLPQGHRGTISTFAFSPDGKLLATGGCDGMILVWDWRFLVGSAAQGKSMEPLWEDLGAKDAAIAYRAVATLANEPRLAIAVLKDRLRPVGEEDSAKVRRLMAILESRRFLVRRRAQAELERLGLDAVPLVKRALIPGLPLETRRRVEQALESPAMRRWTPAMVRRLRALHALELAGTPEAKRLLQHVAAGVPEARLTQEAKAALRRLGGPHGPGR